MLDACDRRQTFPGVITSKIGVRVFEQSVLARIIVDRAGDRRSQSGEVCTTIDSVDRIGEGIYRFGIRICVLQRDFDNRAFDLTINVSQIGPDRAVNIITDTVRDVKFHPVTYSVKAMEDRELAARVRASLIDSYPDVDVQVRDGDVCCRAKGLKKEKEDKLQSLREEIQGMEGEIITMQDLFSYDQVGLDSEGKAVGRFMATGIRSRHLDRMESLGLSVSPQLFERRVLRSDGPGEERA